MVRVILIPIALISISFSALAERATLNNSKIEFVAVNGAEDAPNPGTTCIRVTEQIPESCNGYMAIPNNNNSLISAALHAKATGKDVWIHYEVPASAQHCPGIVFTNCTVSSIGLR